MLLTRERDLSVAIRSALRDGDPVVADKLGAELREVRSSLGMGNSPFPTLSAKDLRGIPEYRRPGSITSRLDTRTHRVVHQVSPYADVAPVTDAELSSFSWGGGSRAERIRSDERLARRMFAQDMLSLPADLAQERMKGFERFLSLYRRLGEQIGRSGGSARSGVDPRVLRLESELRSIVRTDAIPAWYMVVTGRLFPLYVQEGAGSASSGYLRPGYGS